MIEFFMPMEKVPTATHQQKQIRVVNGKPILYEPADLKAARAKLTAHLAQHRPAEPLEGPLSLLVKWCFQATDRHPADTWRDTPPDTDNLQKMLKDIMAMLGFYKNDAQVAQEIIEKFWAGLPGIYIRITKLD